MEDINSNIDIHSIDAQKKGNKKLSVERIYQKKTQLEHILLRPDTYIGSVETLTQPMWVYDDEVGMVHREVTFVPGLYKIFDEILVNAADNKQRDPKMDCMKVDIDPENNKIVIWNNGRGIPVVEHKVEKMFVPSLIFGHLLTSSNYNDEEKKVTGGRNGYGAKLCNIFSTKFIVETSSKESGKCFKQTWTQNMGKTNDPKIFPYGGEDYTRITFYPDLSKFKMDVLDKDIIALMSRRAFDVAGSNRIKVYLNGKRLPIKSFKDYVEQYLRGKEDEDGNPLKVAYEKPNDRWEVAVTLSDKGFQQVSFVNSIATTQGGRHVEYITDQLVGKLSEAVKKKNKGGVNVKAFQLKSHMWVFVNCLIENPTFDSQTKENMTLQPKSFGSKCQPSEKFNAQLLKCGILESILTWIKFKAQVQLNTKCSAKKHSKLKGVPKLEDANDAGTKNSIHCTLILTEGDSAKTLAVSGLGVVGRDKYGVFPLRGKMLNVREATHKQILENAEINNIIKIMGLQYKKKYDTEDDLKTLRYGRLMIMTDQDQDGSHIKGLLINFIHHNWPSLLHLHFLEEFITPIVKVFKGKEEKSFYSLPEFEEWKTRTTNWNSWKVKYYKGLGTSSSKEAKEYFSDMARHRISFEYKGTEDDNSIMLAFSKKMVEQRKEWLTNGMQERKRRRELGLSELYLYGKNTHAVTYSDFVNKELILFSNMDNERSIPSLVDGLKPGQRKVIFTCFKRNDKREIKVAQLAGSVAEHSAYHHGETSLMGTIINLAQNFVGSNNINLLQPIGQFGTRLQGGKDAASPRYIFTMLSPLAKRIFSTLDEPLLRHLYDDNLKIEPEYYCPIIPMVLVNGAEGIGTGWSTKVPNYNPREIVSNIKRMINGEEPLPMKPWFKNFRGQIEQLDSQRFVTNGEVAVLGANRIEITELPIRVWTQAYKEQVLETMLHGSEKNPSLIMDYKEYHTDTTVRFLVSMSDEKLAMVEDQGPHKTFKLQSVVSTSQMVLFDHNGCIRRYETPGDILVEFFNMRLDLYSKRKEYLEGMLKAEASKLESQARFILEKIDGKVVIENKKKAEMIRQLQDRGYPSDPVKAWKESHAKEQLEEQQQDSDSEDENATSGPDYDYLLGMNMWSLTRERKEELLKKRDDKKAELEMIQRHTPASLWIEDLDGFLEELDRVEQQEREDEQAGLAGKAIKSNKNAPGGARKAKKAALEETSPSPLGRRIEPKIDPELRKRHEKPAGADGKKKGRPRKEAMGKTDEDDEPAPLSERIGNSPEKAEKVKAKRGLKQMPLSFKPKKGIPSPKKGPKRNPWSASESEESLSDKSDHSDSGYIPPERRESAPRRAAATKAKYTFDSDDDDENKDVDDSDKEDRAMSPLPDAEVCNSQSKDDSDSDMEAPSKEIEHKSKPVELDSDDHGDTAVNGARSPVVTSDSDDEGSIFKSGPKPPATAAAGDVPTLFNKKPAAPAADSKLSLFDSLLENKLENNSSSAHQESRVSPPPAPDSDSDSSVGLEIETKPEPKVGAARKRPRKKDSGSDNSDDEFVPKPKKSTAAPKKPPGQRGRKKKVVVVVKEGSDSEEAPKSKKNKKPPSDEEAEDIRAAKSSAPRARSARARAPIKYNFGEDSSDEEF